MLKRFNNQFVFVLILLNGAVFSQQEGTVEIVLRDPNGAAVTQGTITISSTNGKKKLEAEIEGSIFRLPKPPHGDYILEVRSPGFDIHTNRFEVTGSLKLIEIDLELEEIKLN